MQRTVCQTSRRISDGQLTCELFILNVNNQEGAFRILRHKAHCRTVRFTVLAFDRKQAWFEVLGLADPPHPVHFLWSHWPLVQGVKRGSHVGR